MSRKTVHNTSLLDILPPNLKNDPDIIAASKAVDNSFSGILEELIYVSPLYHLENQKEDVIDHLLYQFHIIDDEGKSLAQTKDEKIGLIDSSFEIHQKKGTKAALERVLEQLNIRAKVLEWFDYGGEPYHFKLEVTEVDNSGFDDNKQKLLDRLIESHKNKRSWIEKIEIFLTGIGSEYLGATILSGEELTVYPWTIRALETNGVYNTGVAIQSVDKVTIYPLARTLLELNLEIKPLMTMQGIEELTSYPGIEGE